MNTKTDGISSGLVAVAWLAPSNYEWPSHFISMTEIRNGEPLVRLSDAEAIINDLQTLVIAENQRKQQLEEDRDTWKARAEFSYAQRDKQSAALKLAKEAFSAINIEAKTFMSYENARNNFSDDTDERKAYERAMVKASELTKQALAAIDALGE